MNEILWIKGYPPPPLAVVLRPQDPARALETLRAYKQAGIQTLVSLLREDEAMLLGLEDEGALVEQAGMRFVSYPIFDACVPQDTTSFKRFAAGLADRLGAGIRVGVHCRGSIGRATVTAACALIHLGWKPKAALAAVQAARGCTVPDTEEQRRWILDYKAMP
jgi:protein-tyrosine phosphatase